MAWQERHRYGRRALGETAIGRIKTRCGGRLHARSLSAQKKEIAIQIRAVNKMIIAAKPIIVRIA